MLTESDLVEIMGYYHAGDNSKLLNAFQRFDLHDWVTECNEWKRKHAQEFSDFLQHVISILPSEYTSMRDGEVYLGQVTTQPAKVTGDLAELMELCNKYTKLVVHTTQ